MNSKILLEQLLQISVWLPIKNYNNYEISICGSVRNFKTKKILRPRINPTGYYIVDLSKNGNQKTHTIHRLVARQFIPKFDKNNCVDHIDNNTLNNTISNLRWCTLSQNQFNRQLNKNNTSGTKGVYFDKRSQRWCAEIRYHHKHIHIGHFVNLEDAKNARQKKSTELFGIYQNSCEK